MKTFIIIISVTIAVFLYGCGNDTVTNSNSGPVNTVYFQLDSFSLRSSEFGLLDTNFSTSKILDLDSFKVSFSISTNTDSNSYDYASYSIVDSGNVILMNTLRHPFTPGQSYLFYGYSENGTTTKGINLNIALRNTAIPPPEVFLTITNFKIESK